jgi:membrane fusion protein (multidrug efflux system)
MINIDEQSEGAAFSTDEPAIASWEDSELNRADEQVALSEAAKRRRRLLVGVLAVLLVLGSAAAWFLYSRMYESTDDAQVDGHLNVISSRIAGTTAAVYVSENQTVEAGQPLMDLDPSELNVALAQAKAQYDQALDQLKSRRPGLAITEADNAAAFVTGDAEVAEAKAAFAAAAQDLQSASAKLAEAEAVRSRDESQLQRYKQLFAKNEVSRQDYENYVAAAGTAAASANAAKANMVSAQRTLDQRKAQIDAQLARRQQVASNAPRQMEIRQADVATAEADLEAAAAQLQRATLNLSFCHIVSPVHGVVTQNSAEIGNRVSEAQPLMMVVETTSSWITADFKETQMSRMRVGQRATVHIDALKKDMEGTVESIPAITGARSSVLPPENATGNFIKVVQRMPVRIRLHASQDDLQRLRPGMSVEATVWLK